MGSKEKDIGGSILEINKEEAIRPSAEELKSVEEDMIDLGELKEVDCDNGGNITSAYNRWENDKAIRKYKETGDIRYRDEVITHNVPLVKKVVSKYFRQDLVKSSVEFEFEDLVQEGIIGLMKAIEYFNFEFNCSFSTYAYWWIRQAVCRYKDNCSNTIRLPVHVVEGMKRFKKAESEIQSNSGGYASIDEIARRSGMSIRKCEDLAKIRSSSVISLDKEVDNEDRKGSDSISAFIEDKSVNVEEDVINKLVVGSAIEKIKEILSDREYYILCERNGLSGGCPRTLESIAKEMGVTRERVRQIECKALRRLRNPKYSRMFIDDMSRVRRVNGVNSDYIYN